MDSFGYLDLKETGPVQEYYPKEALVSMFATYRRKSDDRLISTMSLVPDNESRVHIDTLKKAEKPGASRDVLTATLANESKVKIPQNTTIQVEIKDSDAMHIPFFQYADRDKYRDLEFRGVSLQDILKKTVNLKNFVPSPAESPITTGIREFDMVSDHPSVIFTKRRAKFANFYTGPTMDEDHGLALHGSLQEPIVVKITNAFQTRQVTLPIGYDMIVPLHEGTIQFENNLPKKLNLDTNPDFERIVATEIPQDIQIAQKPSIPTEPVSRNIVLPPIPTEPPAFPTATSTIETQTGAPTTSTIETQTGEPTTSTIETQTGAPETSTIETQTGEPTPPSPQVPSNLPFTPVPQASPMVITSRPVALQSTDETIPSRTSPVGSVVTQTTAQVPQVPGPIPMMPQSIEETTPGRTSPVGSVVADQPPPVAFPDLFAPLDRSRLTTYPRPAPQPTQPAPVVDEGFTINEILEQMKQFIQNDIPETKWNNMTFTYDPDPNLLAKLRGITERLPPKYILVTPSSDRKTDTKATYKVRTRDYPQYARVKWIVASSGKSWSVSLQEPVDIKTGGRKASRIDVEFFVIPSSSVQQAQAPQAFVEAEAPPELREAEAPPGLSPSEAQLSQIVEEAEAPPSLLIRGPIDSSFQSTTQNAISTFIHSVIPLTPLEDIEEAVRNYTPLTNVLNTLQQTYPNQVYTLVEPVYNPIENQWTTITESTPNDTRIRIVAEPRVFEFALRASQSSTASLSDELSRTIVARNAPFRMPTNNQVLPFVRLIPQHETVIVARSAIFRMPPNDSTQDFVRIIP
jgi:hypothetical protein